jgi:hypothetical protein
MKNLSKLELSELLVLMARIDKMVKSDFLHVSDKMDAKVKKSLQSYYDKLCKEEERRENQK